MKRKRAQNDFPLQEWSIDYSRLQMSEKDVGSGSWVLIKTKIPVSEKVRPVTYGIYWAIPAADEFGRQKVKVYTPEEVCLLNYEYTPLSEERVQEYRKNGYYLCETSAVRPKSKLELKIIEDGRALCEEEREIIWALQLDGLSEMQACEEYFLTHHIDDSNISICFLPSEEILSEICAVFGENGVPG